MTIRFKKPIPLEILIKLVEALQIEPKYNQKYCGCGEGWSDERCDKMIIDGEHTCIFEYIEFVPTTSTSNLVNIHITQLNYILCVYHVHIKWTEMIEKSYL